MFPCIEFVPSLQDSPMNDGEKKWPVDLGHEVKEIKNKKKCLETYSLFLMDLVGKTFTGNKIPPEEMPMQLGSIRCNITIRPRSLSKIKYGLFCFRQNYFLVVQTQQAICRTSAATFEMTEPHLYFWFPGPETLTLFTQSWAVPTEYSI